MAIANILLFCELPAKAAVGVNVDYHTQEEIKAYIKENGATLEEPLIFEKIKNIKTSSKTQYTIGQLKKGKTYYFKIRAYKIVNGKQVYGAYSQVKKTKRGI